MPVVRSLHLALAAVIVASLPACQPAPPLMSPLETTRGFGYTDRQIGEDRLEVGYTTPRRLVTSFSLRPTDADTEPVRSLALDLALWHAAERCRAVGRAGFRVLSRDTVIDSHPEPSYGLPELATAPWPYFRSPSGLIYGGTSVPSLSIRARATITVQLLSVLQPDDIDATALIDRMRVRHPAAEMRPDTAAATSLRP